ncbi:MAG: SIR2 family protein [Myxococcales bacterium]|nr:SIR2 family protein [Myxococcales bacterium]
MSNLAYASLMGSLGLFVGTGFSIDVSGGRAPRFEELLRRVAGQLEVEWSDSDARFLRRSLPQVASLLVELTATNRNVSWSEAERALKAEVARLTDVMPASRQLSDKLKALTLAWIVTTNYDLVLESLIDEAESLQAHQPFVARYGGLPIYHLHGHRRFPESIKITEEDYVSMVGPLDYQRLKLPLLMVESTTLMLGYGLGDVNVRAAMAWARGFCGDQGLVLDGAQGMVVQAFYSPGSSSSAPYYGPDGELVLQVASIGELLDEVYAVREELRLGLQNLRDSISAFLSSADNAVRVAVDDQTRQAFLELVKKAQWPLCATSVLLDFLDRALAPVWEEAVKPNQFSYYETYLALVLDVIERLEPNEIHPNLVAYVGDALDRVGEYIGDGTGYAWAATRTWRVRAPQIDAELARLLSEYGRAHGKASLDRLITPLTSSANSGT